MEINLFISFIVGIVITFLLGFIIGTMLERFSKEKEEAALYNLHKADFHNLINKYNNPKI